MSSFERIYPRKPRKPVKSEDSKRRERQRRAHKRIAKTRHKEKVKTWREWRELQRIKINPDQSAMTDYFPKDDARPQDAKKKGDPKNGV